MKYWQTKSTEIKYENPWISVREDMLIRPDGSDGMYGVVSLKSPGALIVPIDDDGNTYLTRQERYTTGEERWEIPAGGIDGQSLEEAAKRELLEEAGICAGTITEISTIYVAVGFSDHKGIVCLATDLEQATDQLDTVDGILEARKFPLAEVKDMILRGEINDGVTIAAFFTVMAYLEKQKS